MKKIIFALAAFLLFAAPALAKPTGTVPVIPPLQPAPAGVTPNFSGNVQYGTPVEQSSQQNPQTKKESNQPAESLTSPQQTEDQGKSLGWIAAFSIFFGGLIAAAWWFYRRDKTRAKQ